MVRLPDAPKPKHQLDPGRVPGVSRDVWFRHLLKEPRYATRCKSFAAGPIPGKRTRAGSASRPTPMRPMPSKIRRFLEPKESLS